MAKDSSDAKRSYTETPKIIQIRDYLFDRHDYRLNTVANDYERSVKGKNAFHSISDEQQLSYELYTAGFKGFERQLTALLKSDQIPASDPIRAYFDSLPGWQEGDMDYIEGLAWYVDVSDKAWFNRMFKKALVRTAACALGVIPFNKQCFVLYGKQNDGKTSFLRYLCPPALQPYYTEYVDFASKDGLVSLTSNFIINIDELRNIDKQEANKLKAFFTTEKVKVRRPYDKKDSEAQRRASFFGSTNNAEMLTDETGNVRWLIFEIAGIQHDNGGPNGYMALDINRVWSQVNALLKSGFDFQVSREEMEISEKINRRKYFRTTQEMDLIEEYLEPSTKDDPEADFLNATSILLYLTCATENRLRINPNSVGKALSFLNFSQTDHRIDGKPRKGYWVKKLKIVNLPTAPYDKRLMPLKEKELRVVTF